MFIFRSSRSSANHLFFVLQKKVVASARASDQKAIDQSILASIKKEDFLGSYLATTFSLRNGDKPHEMKW
jgi:large subunit ribosomal protein L6e